jgi:hypothetical protein
MCLAHDSDEYGVLRWTVKELARAIGCPPRLITNLIAGGVIYGCEKGPCQPMVYVPKSGRHEGDPVELIAAQAGPIFYSPRMVKDEYLRELRTGSLPTHAPHKAAPDPAPDPPSYPSPMGPMGEGSDARPTFHPSPHPTLHPHTGTDPDNRKIGESIASAECTETRERTRALTLDTVKALREMGMRDVHSGRADLVEALAAGVGGAEFTATAAELTERRGDLPSLSYLISTIRGRRADLARAGPVAASRPSRVTADFAEASYTGTPDDELPPELR